MSRPLPGAPRDRHGRGLRSPLLPAGLPASRTRAQVFDDLVLDAREHLEQHWHGELEGLEFAVQDVPPIGRDDDEVPLARLLPGRGRTAPRIVVYRRPLEARGKDPLDLADLVHDVVVEQVAAFLGVDPDTVDPEDE